MKVLSQLALPLLDCLIIALCFIVCGWLVNAPTILYYELLLFEAIFLGTLLSGRVYSISVGHFGVSALPPISLSALLSGLTVFWLRDFSDLEYVFLVSLTCSCTIVLARLLVREMKYNDRQTHAVNTLVYGAGVAGVQFLTAAMQGDRYNIIAFIDDETDLFGKSIHGRRVFPAREIDRLINERGITTIVLALPSVSKSRRSAILEELLELPVRVLSVPNLQEILEGRSNVDDTQEVSIEDLLDRETIQPDLALLKQTVLGKNILVTGAGGSIGSEICRQLACLNPKSLILLEISEPALFRVEQDLTNHCEVLTHYILGSVLDEDLLSHVFAEHEIDSVFHAAAYKHVPLVEANPKAGFINNVIGTTAVLRASLEADCSSFTLVSTDKAVRPTNIMGATKRLAELICQAEAKYSSSTTISMVRFGNVLGSSGSVIPTFRKQIAQGGPVTLTHEDITRFFMSIPEAAQLVIQSSAIAKGGDLFLLDMGKAVKIYDLARRLIRLSGKTVAVPGTRASGPGDIEIRVTGLRPGEKLYEELLIDELSETTQHPKIMRAVEPALDSSKLKTIISELSAALDADELDRFREQLSAAGIGYRTPSHCD